MTIQTQEMGFCCGSDRYNFAVTASSTMVAARSPLIGFLYLQFRLLSMLPSGYHRPSHHDFQ
ncbi:hypothetical protein JYQ62_09180 [Nostoc sp. UHCC 0702]|nr:hypothetical protein JYQ62_09180 [Nostoc sp. UHCC 0702]